MKKILLLALFAATSFLKAQITAPDYTTCLDHSPAYLPDSTVVTGSTNNTIQRVIYTYDFKERLVNRRFRDLQSNQTDVKTFAYDTNDSLLLKVSAAGQSAPTYTNKTVISRNAAKQMAFDTVSAASGAQYTLSTASTYSYNTSGNLAENITDLFSGSWAPFNRRQFQHNSSGKITSFLFQGWVNSAWENMSQYNNTYNSNNDLVLQVYQAWVPASSTWKNSGKNTNVYTGAHLDTTTNYTWNGTTWENDVRTSYSPAGTIDSVTIEIWNGTLWEGAARFVRTWSQGRLVNMVEKGYTNAWYNDWKYDFQYDANGNHVFTNTYIYLSLSGTWTSLITTDHYYRKSTVGLKEVDMNDTKTYPVPSAGLLYFESSVPVRGGVLYSTSGQELQYFEGGSTNLSALSPGVYYVKLKLENGSQRMVKAIRE